MRGTVWHSAPCLYLNPNTPSPLGRGLIISHHNTQWTKKQCLFKGNVPTCGNRRNTWILSNCCFLDAFDVTAVTCSFFFVQMSSRNDRYLLILHLFASRIGTFFILFRHIAVAFVTVSLGLNRGSHYELVHTGLTKRTTVWLGSYNRQRAFNFGSGFSIVKVECPLSIIWPKSNCGALRHSSVHLTKRPPRFQINMRVTKSIAMCRIKWKCVDSACRMVY